MVEYANPEQLKRHLVNKHVKNKRYQVLSSTEAKMIDLIGGKNFGFKYKRGSRINPEKLENYIHNFVDENYDKIKHHFRVIPTNKPVESELSKDAQRLIGKHEAIKDLSKHLSEDVYSNKIKDLHGEFKQLFKEHNEDFSGFESSGGDYDAKVNQLVGAMKIMKQHGFGQHAARAVGAPGNFEFEAPQKEITDIDEESASDALNIALDGKTKGISAIKNNLDSLSNHLNAIKHSEYKQRVANSVYDKLSSAIELDANKKSLKELEEVKEKLGDLNVEGLDSDALVSKVEDHQEKKKKVLVDSLKALTEGDAHEKFGEMSVRDFAEHENELSEFVKKLGSVKGVADAKTRWGNLKNVEKMLELNDSAEKLEDKHNIDLSSAKISDEKKEEIIDFLKKKFTVRRVINDKKVQDILNKLETTMNRKDKKVFLKEGAIATKEKAKDVGKKTYEKGKEVAGKAYETSKEGAGKVYVKGKEVAKKGYESGKEGIKKGEELGLKLGALLGEKTGVTPKLEEQVNEKITDVELDSDELPKGVKEELEGKITDFYKKNIIKQKISVGAIEEEAKNIKELHEEALEHAKRIAKKEEAQGLESKRALKREIEEIQNKAKLEKLVENLRKEKEEDVKNATEKINEAKIKDIPKILEKNALEKSDLPNNTIENIITKESEEALNNFLETNRLEKVNNLLSNMEHEKLREEFEVVKKNFTDVLQTRIAKVKPEEVGKLKEKINFLKNKSEFKNLRFNWNRYNLELKEQLAKKLPDAVEYDLLNDENKKLITEKTKEVVRRAMAGKDLRTLGEFVVQEELENFMPNGMKLEDNDINEIEHTHEFFLKQAARKELKGKSLSEAIEMMKNYDLEQGDVYDKDSESSPLDEIIESATNKTFEKYFKEGDEKELEKLKTTLENSPMNSYAEQLDRVLQEHLDSKVSELEYNEIEELYDKIKNNEKLDFDYLKQEYSDDVISRINEDKLKFKKLNVELLNDEGRTTLSPKVYDVVSEKLEKMDYDELKENDPEKGFESNITGLFPEGFEFTKAEKEVLKGFREKKLSKVLGEKGFEELTEEQKHELASYLPEEVKKKAMDLDTRLMNDIRTSFEGFEDNNIQIDENVLKKVRDENRVKILHSQNGLEKYDKEKANEFYDEGIELVNNAKEIIEKAVKLNKRAEALGVEPFKKEVTNLKEVNSYKKELKAKREEVKEARRKLNDDLVKMSSKDIVEEVKSFDDTKKKEVSESTIKRTMNKAQKEIRALMEEQPSDYAKGINENYKEIQNIVNEMKVLSEEWIAPKSVDALGNYGYFKSVITREIEDTMYKNLNDDFTEMDGKIAVKNYLELNPEVRRFVDKKTLEKNIEKEIEEEYKGGKEGYLQKIDELKGGLHKVRTTEEGTVEKVLESIGLASDKRIDKEFKRKALEQFKKEDYKSMVERYDKEKSVLNEKELSEALNKKLVSFVQTTNIDNAIETLQEKKNWDLDPNKTKEAFEIVVKRTLEEAEQKNSEFIKNRINKIRESPLRDITKQEEDEFVEELKKVYTLRKAAEIHSQVKKDVSGLVGFPESVKKQIYALEEQYKSEESENQLKEEYNKQLVKRVNAQKGSYKETIEGVKEVLDNEDVYDPKLVSEETRKNIFEKVNDTLVREGFNKKTSENVDEFIKKWENEVSSKLVLTDKEKKVINDSLKGISEVKKNEVVNKEYTKFVEEELSKETIDDFLTYYNTTIKDEGKLSDELKQTIKQKINYRTQELGWENSLEDSKEYAKSIDDEERLKALGVGYNQKLSDRVKEVQKKNSQKENVRLIDLTGMKNELNGVYSEKLVSEKTKAGLVNNTKEEIVDLSKKMDIINVENLIDNIEEFTPSFLRKNDIKQVTDTLIEVMKDKTFDLAEEFLSKAPKAKSKEDLEELVKAYEETENSEIKGTKLMVDQTKELFENSISEKVVEYANRLDKSKLIDDLNELTSIKGVTEDAKTELPIIVNEYFNEEVTKDNYDERKELLEKENDSNKEQIDFELNKIGLRKYLERHLVNDFERKDFEDRASELMKKLEKTNTKKEFDEVEEEIKKFIDDYKESNKKITDFRKGLGGNNFEEVLERLDKLSEEEQKEVKETTKQKLFEVTKEALSTKDAVEAETITNKAVEKLGLNEKELRKVLERSIKEQYKQEDDYSKLEERYAKEEALLSEANKKFVENKLNKKYNEFVKKASADELIDYTKKFKNMEWVDLTQQNKTYAILKEKMLQEINADKTFKYLQEAKKIPDLTNDKEFSTNLNKNYTEQKADEFIRSGKAKGASAYLYALRELKAEPNHKFDEEKIKEIQSRYNEELEKEINKVYSGKKLVNVEDINKMTKEFEKLLNNSELYDKDWIQESNVANKLFENKIMNIASEINLSEIKNWLENFDLKEKLPKTISVNEEKIKNELLDSAKEKLNKKAMDYLEEYGKEFVVEAEDIKKDVEKLEGEYEKFVSEEIGGRKLINVETTEAFEKELNNNAKSYSRMADLDELLENKNFFEDRSWLKDRDLIKNAISKRIKELSQESSWDELIGIMEKIESKKLENEVNISPLTNAIYKEENNKISTLEAVYKETKSKEDVDFSEKASSKPLSKNFRKTKESLEKELERYKAKDEKQKGEINKLNELMKQENIVDAIKHYNTLSEEEQQRVYSETKEEILNKAKGRVEELFKNGNIKDVPLLINLIRDTTDLKSAVVQKHLDGVVEKQFKKITDFEEAKKQFLETKDYVSDTAREKTNSRLNALYRKKEVKVTENPDELLDDLKQDWMNEETRIVTKSKLNNKVLAKAKTMSLDELSKWIELRVPKLSAENEAKMSKDVLKVIDELRYQYSRKKINAELDTSDIETGKDLANKKLEIIKDLPGKYKSERMIEEIKRDFLKSDLGSLQVEINTELSDLKPFEELKEFGKEYEKVREETFNGKNILNEEQKDNYEKKLNKKINKFIKRFEPEKQVELIEAVKDKNWLDEENKTYFKRITSYVENKKNRDIEKEINVKKDVSQLKTMLENERYSDHTTQIKKKIVENEKDLKELINLNKNKEFSSQETILEKKILSELGKETSFKRINENGLENSLKLLSEVDGNKDFEEVVKVNIANYLKELLNTITSPEFTEKVEALQEKIDSVEKPSDYKKLEEETQELIQEFNTREEERVKEEQQKIEEKKQEEQKKKEKEAEEKVRLKKQKEEDKKKKKDEKMKEKDISQSIKRNENIENLNELLENEDYEKYKKTITKRITELENKKQEKANLEKQKLEKEKKKKKAEKVPVDELDAFEKEEKEFEKLDDKNKRRKQKELLKESLKYVQGMDVDKAVKFYNSIENKEWAKGNTKKQVRKALITRIDKVISKRQLIEDKQERKKEMEVVLSNIPNKELEEEFRKKYKIEKESTKEIVKEEEPPKEDLKNHSLIQNLIKKTNSDRKIYFKKLKKFIGNDEEFEELEEHARNAAKDDKKKRMLRERDFFTNTHWEDILEHTPFIKKLVELHEKYWKEE